MYLNPNRQFSVKQQIIRKSQSYFNLLNMIYYNTSKCCRQIIACGLVEWYSCYTRSGSDTVKRLCCKWIVWNKPKLKKETRTQISFASTPVWLFFCRSWFVHSAACLLRVRYGCTYFRATSASVYVSMDTSWTQNNCAPALDATPVSVAHSDFSPPKQLSRFDLTRSYRRLFTACPSP